VAGVVLFQEGDAPMSANETAAMSSIMLTTNCTFAEAEAALAALIEAGWQGPSGQLETALPGTADNLCGAGGVLMAHTDGACSGNPGPGGWAVVFSQGGVVVSEHCGRVDHATNNQMELMAIREAVSRAPLDADLEILTDSRNAVGWLADRWKRNNPVIAALCRNIESLKAKRSGKITYKHVRGHQGNTLNERADRLATGAIQRTARGPLLTPY
jgi:ribonuclease HI